jgi:hypothetical protein
LIETATKASKASNNSKAAGLDSLGVRFLETNTQTDTRQGLNASMEKNGFDGDGFGYLRNPTWWAGITTSERTCDGGGERAG